MTRRWMRTMAVLMLASAVSARAGTVVSQGSGNWDAGATWGGTAPTAADDVFIQSGHTVTMTGLTARSVNSLSITGVLAHADNTTNEAHKILLDIAGDLTIVNTGSETGRIDVTGLGYDGGRGPGKGVGRDAGGGYGGEGGPDFNSTVFGVTYGSITHPVNLGSGNGLASGSSRSGGGAVILTVVGTATIDGNILAEGLPGGWEFGGGAGGSVFLTAGTVAGGGRISVDGGDVGTGGKASGGGGGRLAVVLTNATDFSSVSMTAYGGRVLDIRYHHGGAGTIYRRGTAHTNGLLIVDNSQGWASEATYLFKRGCTPWTNGLARFDEIRILGRGFLEVSGSGLIDFSSFGTLTGDSDLKSRLTFASTSNLAMPASFEGIRDGGVLSFAGTNFHTFTGDWVIQSGGCLSHEENKGTAPSNMLMMRLHGNLSVNTGGFIRVDTRGYRGDVGPGKPAHLYCGAGYGGEGGDGEGQTDKAGTTYGSILNPVDLGSGSRYYGAENIEGGGVIMLDITGGLTVNGTISSVGENGLWERGAGAGGSINIRAGTMDGAGLITAAGGMNPSSKGGGGGGGRIALVLTNGTDTGLVTVSAPGGLGGTRATDYDGAAGTVYLRFKDDACGTATIAEPNTTPAVTHLPPFTNSVPDELKPHLLVLTNRARVVATADAWVGDMVIDSNAFLTLSNHFLNVNTPEHDLGNPALPGPGNTNRVDHYEQIMWKQSPGGTVILVR